MNNNKEQGFSRLEELHQHILKRIDDGDGYSSRLFSQGKNRIAQKVGEEATETIIAALSESKEKLAEETADLLFHLLMLLYYCDLEPKKIIDILCDRQK